MCCFFCREGEYKEKVKKKVQKKVKKKKRKRGTGGDTKILLATPLGHKPPPIDKQAKVMPPLQRRLIPVCIIQSTQQYGDAMR
jgi:hypothetical protein